MIYDNYAENEGDTFDEVYEEYQKRYGGIEVEGAEESEPTLVAHSFISDHLLTEQPIEDLAQEKPVDEQPNKVVEEPGEDEPVKEPEPEEYEEEYMEAPVVKASVVIAPPESPKVSCPFIEEEEKEKCYDEREMELVHAKNFLQSASKMTGDNLYDHLTDVLNKILAERPSNIIDVFEEYSRQIKEKRFKPMTDHLEDIFVEPERFHLAQCIMPWLKMQFPQKGKKKKSKEVDMSGNNLLELLFYLEQIGLGLTRHEMTFITLSMRQLAKTEPIVAIRFWGKIFGRFNNYIIVETELEEGEYIKRNESQKKIYSDTYLYKSYSHNPEENKINSMSNNKNDGEADNDSTGEQKLPPLPKMEYNELPEPPDECSGYGLNQKVYYVCNGVGNPWVQLPDVTPKEVRICRGIHKSFSGYLEQDVNTYPEFPGKEKNYLRAQIARITAGTEIAPMGFYVFDGQYSQETAEYNSEDPKPLDENNLIKNEKYKPPTLKQLLDKSFWVHTAPYILPQGRTTWWRPPAPFPDLEDDESIECLCTGGTCVACIVEQVKNIVPETGPPLLSPCNIDVSSENVTPWSVRMSSNITDEFALVLMRSNIWPGAYSFTTQGNRVYNIYLGYGLKYLKANFTPLPLPQVQQEYPIGPEVLEILDQGEEPWMGSEEEEMDDHWGGLPPMEKFDAPEAELNY